MDRPWMKLHTRDWLDNKELRRCSPMSRAILADLMCLAHEGVPYGHLSDKVGPLSCEYMAARCVVSLRVFHKAIVELKTNDRIAQESDLFIPRMVSDEDIRVRRAAGGSASIGHPSTHPPKTKEGYPSDHPSLKIDSRARALADSDSDSCVSSSKKVKGEIPKRVVPMPQPVDYGARYRALYERHIIPGFMQDGEYEYHKIITSEMGGPEKTADAIDAAHVEWMGFFHEHPDQYRPGIGKWLKDGYWVRRPKARDSPPRLSVEEQAIQLHREQEARKQCRP